MLLSYVARVARVAHRLHKLQVCQRGVPTVLWQVALMNATG